MRTLLALCLVALITATTGGGLAFAQTVADAPAVSAPLSAELSLADADHCVYVSQRAPNTAPLAVAATPPAPCSQDCKGLLPCAVGHTGQQQPRAFDRATALLVALAPASQLPPPRA